MDERNMQHGVEWGGEDPAGWLMSEKLDGCRAYWDGHDMWSRGGMKVKLPPSWQAALPEGVQLDGELYYGPGGVYRCGVALRYGRFTSTMRFMVFDGPTMAGFWPERMQQAAVLTGDNTVVQCVPHRKCLDLDDAVDELRRVWGRGGEGIMLRAPDHKYRVGHSPNLLKFKEFA